MLDFETWEWILVGIAFAAALASGVAYGIWRGGRR